MSRHIVVAPIPSAPLLTDTRRSTVGPGTREDVVPSSCCVRSAVLVVEYIALALAAIAALVSVAEHIAPSGAGKVRTRRALGSRPRAGTVS